MAEDIGRQILTSGTRISAGEYVKKVEAVTPASIASAAKTLLKSPLTFAAVGDGKLVDACSFKGCAQCPLHV